MEREIPLSVIPYLILAVLAFIEAGAWSAGAFKDKGALVRFAGLACLWAVLSACWMVQSHEESAADWYRWLGPTTWGMDIAGIEAVAQVLKISLPSWYKGFYAMAGAAFLAAIFWHPMLIRAPNRIWMVAAGGASLGMAVLAAVWVLALVYMGVRAVHMDAWLRAAYFITVAVTAALLFNTDVWTLSHPSVWPQDWLALLLLLGGVWYLASRPTLEQANSDGLAGMMSLPDALAFGDRMLDASPAAVLVVVMDRFEELSVTYGLQITEEVSVRLGRELRHLCRERDRVSQWKPGVFVMIFPGVPFYRERDVRVRMVDAIGQLSLQIDGSMVSLAAHVQVGWAWGERGARFQQVVGEALHTTTRLGMSHV